MKLFKNSQATFGIIYSGNAQAIDNHAVSEMALFIRRCEGGDIRVYPFKPTYEYENYMCIGADDDVLEQFGVRVPRETFTDDTVYILVKDNVVVLDGGKRGQLYAVYEFVERFMGVRFYLPEEMKAPKVKDLEIPDCEIVYTPKIRFRNLYSNDMRRDRDFCRSPDNRHCEAPHPSHRLWHRKSQQRRYRRPEGSQIQPLPDLRE